MQLLVQQANLRHGEVTFAIEQFGHPVGAEHFGEVSFGHVELLQSLFDDLRERQFNLMEGKVLLFVGFGQGGKRIEVGHAQLLFLLRSLFAHVHEFFNRVAGILVACLVRDWQD